MARPVEQDSPHRGHGLATALNATVTGEESESSIAWINFEADHATLVTGTCDSETGSATVLGSGHCRGARPPGRAGPRR